MKGKERVLVERCAEGRAKGSEYRMPTVDAVRGMVVGYARGGESAIGCVTRVDESGVWVVRGNRSGGRRNGREGIKVVFNGSCENREEIGRKWRALDLDTEAEECRARVWADDVRDTDLEVRVTSSAEHCACKMIERKSCGRVAESVVTVSAAWSRAHHRCCQYPLGLVECKRYRQQQQRQCQCQSQPQPQMHQTQTHKPRSRARG